MTLPARAQRLVEQWREQAATNGAIYAQGITECADALAALLASPEAPKAASPTMADVAEMLWVVLANVSGGDWTKQSQEWQDAAARFRDQYFAALNAERLASPDEGRTSYQRKRCHGCAKGLPVLTLDIDGVLSSVSGRHGAPAHAVDDAWWPCTAYNLPEEWQEAERAMIECAESWKDRALSAEGKLAALVAAFSARGPDLDPPPVAEAQP